MGMLGATDHVMLGSGMPVATQVRMAGLVSFTTTATVEMFTSRGTEQIACDCVWARSVFEECGYDVDTYAAMGHLALKWLNISAIQQEI